MGYRDSVQFALDALVVCCLGFAYVALLTALSVVHASLRAARAVDPLSTGRQQSESGAH